MKKGILAFLSTVAAGWLVAWLKGISPIDLIGAIFTYLLLFTKACWSIGVQKSEMPNWLLGLLILFSTYPLAKILRLIIKKNDEPQKSDYTEDRFDGLIWRWSYDFGGSMGDTWCYCPQCDGMIVYSDTYDSGFPPKAIMRLTCEHCKEPRGVFDGHREYNVQRIQRLIDRKIRVGEWRAAVEKQKAKPQ